MTTKTLSRLESLPMIPKFIKKKLRKKDMEYWRELCRIEERKIPNRLISYFKMIRLADKVRQLENKVNELEEKIENVRMENSEEIDRRFVESEHQIGDKKE